MLSKHFTSTEDKADFGIAIAVIALAGVLIGYFSFFYKGSFGLTNEKASIASAKIDQLDIDGKIYVAVNTEDKDFGILPISTKKHQPESTFVLPTKKDTTHQLETVPTITPEDEETISGDDEINYGDQTETPDETQSKIIPENDLAPTPDVKTDSSASTKIETVKAKTPQKKTKAPVHKKRKPKKKSSITDCIIVIGAYENPTNIKNLVGSLYKNGFAIFKVPFKGLTRVGIYANCDSLSSTLNIIQKKYSPEAFVMRSR